MVDGGWWSIVDESDLDNNHNTPFLPKVGIIPKV